MGPYEWKGSLQCIFRSWLKVNTQTGKPGEERGANSPLLHPITIQHGQVSSPEVDQKITNIGLKKGQLLIASITVVQGRWRWLLRGAVADVQRLLQADGHQQGLPIRNVKRL